MNQQVKIYRLLTNAGYYYATPNGRYIRFDKSVDRAWLFCEHHAKEHVPWMTEQELQPVLLLAEDKMFCNQCDVNRKVRAALDAAKEGSE